MMKSQQLALLTPVDWDLEREAHQLLGGKLRRVLAVDDGGDNVRRQQRQTQQSGYVTRRNALLIGDDVQQQVSALDQALMNIMGAGDNSQQAGIG